MFPPDETAEVKAPPLTATDVLEASQRGGEVVERDPAWHEGGLIDERYLLERRLGGGAMGEVWLAGDRLLKKTVALKVLRPDLAKSRATVRRFLQEVALAQSVTHPNVVRIHDTGEAHSLPYFTMEYLAGQTLDQLVGRHGELPDRDTPPMTLREIRDLSIEILDGLDAAHRVGVIHRDLKPANVMLTHRGAILMDFGVAGVEALSGLTRAKSPDPRDARSLIRTEAGTIFGSPAYMAPELWEGASATAASDIYSFGVMLYQMLTGRLPYDAPNAGAFLEKLRTTEPVPVRSLRKDVPWRLAAAVSRCMARAPEMRPASAKSVADLIGPLSRRRGLLVGAALGAVALAAGVAGAWHGEPPFVALGLPDAVAEADLGAAIRAFDAGDHLAARRILDRLETRAPRAAALAFWRATLERELRDHETRLAHCRAGDEEEGGFQGSPAWIELAEAACGSTYTLGDAVLATADRQAGALGDAYLPLAVEGSLIPQLEVQSGDSALLQRRAEAVLDRLAEGPDFQDGPLTPVRWALAEIDLNVALDRLDIARELSTRAVKLHPDAPIVHARAAWLHALLGERERAGELAAAVEPFDPRPAVRVMLEQAELAAAWSRVEVLRGTPYYASALDMWCGYAFRFELPRAPTQCDELGPGLVRTLWGRATGRGTDGATMSPHERTIAAQQAALNRGECLERVELGPVIAHAAPPFELYLVQQQISAAICAQWPAASDLTTARRLAEGLAAAAPDDRWSMLLQAQLEDAGGATALADSKRLVVAESWAGADHALPLVARLRARLAGPAEGAHDPGSL